MLTRRQFLNRAVKGSSLVALGTTVPGFVAATAAAAAPGKDTVLVVLELTGGNDGLNTVIPYADDLYHKARPTLRLTRDQVVRVDDHIGLNPGLRSLQTLLNEKQLAIVQGVGYPNPDRSHFESMDIWQSADPQRKTPTGWLGRALSAAKSEPGTVPGMYVGAQALPLAMRGAAGGVPALQPGRPFDLELSAGGGDPQQEALNRFPRRMPQPASGDDPRKAERRKLIEDLTAGGVRLPEPPRIETARNANVRNGVAR